MLAKFGTNSGGITWWSNFQLIQVEPHTNLEPTQVAFYLAGEIIQVIDSIPWVRCASGNVCESVSMSKPFCECVPMSKAETPVHLLKSFTIVPIAMQLQWTSGTSGWPLLPCLIFYCPCLNHYHPDQHCHQHDFATIAPVWFLSDPGVPGPIFVSGCPSVCPSRHLCET